MRIASRSTAVTLRAGRSQLRRFAARRGAQIDHGFIAHIAKQRYGQGCGGILHPPFPFTKTR